MNSFMISSESAKIMPFVEGKQMEVGLEQKNDVRVLLIEDNPLDSAVIREQLKYGKHAFKIKN